MLTPEDLNSLKQIVAASEDRILERTAAGITDSEERTAAGITDSEERTTADITASEERTTASIAASEKRILEASAEQSRAMQTELLRGIGAFARGNFARMHTLESAEADTRTRVAALEERVTWLETRNRPQ